MRPVGATLHQDCHEHRARDLRDEVEVGGAPESQRPPGPPEKSRPTKDVYSTDGTTSGSPARRLNV